MTLRFFNTLERKVVPFEPLEEGKVKIYACGPTVYGYSHIGNFRFFAFADLLRRYLRFRGYQVTFVMNVTDVDDRIINIAREKGIGINEVTEPFIKVLFEDLDTLNIEPADISPRATEHIEDMVNLVRALKEKGHAYEQDGSYYFSIASFPDYGKLARLEEVDLKAGARLDSDRYEKEDVRDFALWKACKPGEHCWDSDLGRGRPGWHIECSAMAMRYLGKTFDIHLGGDDLIFPHHENEIAQSEGATGVPFVRYWLHARHLIIDGRKMSRSEGNFFTLRELLERGEDARAIRFLLISTHYRRMLNFSFDALKASAATLARLDEFALRLQEESFSPGSTGEMKEAIQRCRNDFIAAMDDDLNISEALAALFVLVRDLNVAADEGRLKADDDAAALGLLRELDKVLGVIRFDRPPLGDAEIENLIEQRIQARAQRNFAEADRIRNLLAERGIILQDTPDGTRWRKASQ
jgi:cysteinyl-tRNA synthetase